MVIDKNNKNISTYFWHVIQNGIQILYGEHEGDEQKIVSITW